MYLKKLHLVQFKNYQEATLDFINGIHCFTGHNGAGKTNLLDAIHYLSLCKSYFNASDSQNIYHDAPLFVIQGIFMNEGEEVNIYCGFKRGQKKQFKKDQKEYSRMADHVGLFPSVMISPTDTVLITEGSDERRKLMDSIISQYDREYLDQLLEYNRALIQRNALLKHYSGSGSWDPAVMEVWDQHLVRLAPFIHRKRKEFLERITPAFTEHYRFISGSAERTGIIYDSQLNNDPMEKLLKEALPRDLALHYSTAGIHKDDLLFTINNFPAKRYASQGQLKSFVIALKLAQFDLLKEIKDVKPILLLDDIFDRLDEKRISRLLDLVSKGSFGQVFITDAHPERTLKIFSELGIDVQVVEVEGGTAKMA